MDINGFACVGIHVQLVPENNKVTLFRAEHEFITCGWKVFSQYE